MERPSWNTRHDGTGANSRGPDRRVRISLPGWQVGGHTRPEPVRRLLDLHDKNSSGGAPLGLILGICIPGGLILIGLVVWFIHSRNKPLQEQREMKDEHKRVDHKNESQVTADLIFDSGDPPNGPGKPSTLESRRASATSQALRKSSEENGVVIGVDRVFLEPQTEVLTHTHTHTHTHMYVRMYVLHTYMYEYTCDVLTNPSLSPHEANIS